MSRVSFHESFLLSSTIIKRVSKERELLMTLEKILSRFKESMRVAESESSTKQYMYNICTLRQYPLVDDYFIFSRQLSVDNVLIL